MNAAEIFVNVPTADDPTKKISMQDAVDLLICEVLDLKTRTNELERYAALSDELATAVRRMQTVFNTLAQQLSGTNAVAKALMQGRTSAKEVN